MLRLLILIMVCFTFTFCNKHEENSTYEDLPVIEAYLKANNIFSLTVSRQIPFSEDVNFSDDDINNLEIIVFSDGNSYTLDPQGNGVYMDSSLIIDDQAIYELNFNYNSKQVYAKTQIPIKPVGFQQSSNEMIFEQPDTTGGGFSGEMVDQPDPINFQWENNNNDFYLIVVENIENQLDPVRDFGDNELPSSSFRDEPTQGNSYQLDSKSISYFGTHRIILYHLNPDYALLYDDGETTSQNLTTPLTGIENGVGIFTGMNSDTLWLEVTE